MAAEVPMDVVEQILLGLDVEDLLRCKSVCKSWRSLVSTPAFVKAHLKHQNDNIIIEGGGYRRISVTFFYPRNSAKDEIPFSFRDMYVVGSCNGLVCVSPKGAEFEVANPCTREIKKLQTPLLLPEERLESIRRVLIMGFGYDASTDDYKVVLGFRKRVFDKQTEFYAFALKSNVWKSIGQVNYLGCFRNNAAIFCGGALHWLMIDAGKKVIMSVDLSTEEFKEIPQPVEADYERGDFIDHVLGVIEECLCIYSLKSSKIWVMKNNKWDLYNNNESKYDFEHYLTGLVAMDSQNMRTGRHVYTIDDGRPEPSDGVYQIRASMFVKSLVSPHPSKGQLEGNNDAKGNIRNRQLKGNNDAKGNIKNRQLEGNNNAKGNIRNRKRKRKKRSCKHIKGSRIISVYNRSNL